MNPWARVYDDLRDRGLTHEAAVAEVEKQKAAQSAPAQKKAAGTHPLNVLAKESGIRKAGRLAVHGLTGGFSDELAGLAAMLANPQVGPEQAASVVQKQREQLGAMREQAPFASLLAEGVGALPLAALNPIAAGGLLGIGEGESPADRVAGGAVGAGLGFALPMAGRLAGRATRAAPKVFGSANRRVAGALRKGVGLADDINAAIKQADELVKETGRKVYGPLETQFATVDDPAIKSLLASPKMKAVRGLDPDIVRGKRDPSFEELQDLRSLLKKQWDSFKPKKAKGAPPNPGNPLEAERFRKLYSELDATMKSKLPGLKEADVAFREVNDARRMLDEGGKHWNAPAAKIERTLNGLRPAAKERYQQGRLIETLRRLDMRDKQAVGTLRGWLDAGPETQRVLRSFFPDDGSFAQFATVLEKERDARKLARLFKSLALVGGGIGAYEVVF